MNNVNITIFIVIFTLALMVISAFYGWRKKRNERQYLVAENNAGFLPLTFSIMGTFLGGGMLVSVAAMGYEAGFVGIVLGLSFFIGLILVGVFVKKFRRVAEESESSGGTTSTILEVWKYKFDEKTYNVSVIIVGVLFIFFLSAQFLALVGFLKFFFGTSFFMSYLIVIVVLVLYTAVTGLEGVYWSDVVQVILIFAVGIIFILPNLISSSEGGRLLAKLPVDYFTGTGYGIVFFIGLIVFVGPSVLVRLETWQRVVSGKSDSTTRKSFIVAGFGMLIFFILFTLIGMLMKVEVGTLEPRTVIFKYFSMHLKGNVMLIALVMILATILSSADSLINVLSISIGKRLGIIGTKNKNEIVDKMNIRELTNISMIAIVISLIAVLMAWIVPDIVRMMINATASLLLLLPATLASVFASKRSATGAVLSITLGFAPIVGFGIIGPLLGFMVLAKTSFVPATIISVASYFIGYYIDKKHGRLIT